MPRLEESSIRSRANSTLDHYSDIVRDRATNVRNWLNKQTPLKRGLIYAFGGVLTIFVLSVLIFHKRIINLLVTSSTTWAEWKYGKLLMFLLVFGVSFPPFLGFSPLSTFTGMIWGFPNGWFLLAFSSITGSVCSFLFFRFILINRSRQLVRKNKNFAVLSEIMKEDKRLLLLILIRLCPLPYSLSNGAFAAIPDISLYRFTVTSLIVSPKLLIHIFVGSKLKDIGKTKSTATKIIDFLSIFIAGLASSVTAYIIYYKMKQKMLKFSEDEQDEDDPELVTLNSNYDNDPASIGDDFDEFIVDDDEEENDDLGLDFEQQRR